MTEACIGCVDHANISSATGVVTIRLDKQMICGLFAGCTFLDKPEDPFGVVLEREDGADTLEKLPLNSMCRLDGVSSTRSGR